MLHWWGRCSSKITGDDGALQMQYYLCLSAVKHSLYIYINRFSRVKMFLLKCLGAMIWLNPNSLKSKIQVSTSARAYTQIFITKSLMIFFFSWIIQKEGKHNQPYLIFITASTDRDQARLITTQWRLAHPFAPSTTACNCGTWVDCLGTHGLSCKLGTGRRARHQQLNDLVWRALERASIPSCREPRNLCGTVNCARTVLPSSLGIGRRVSFWHGTWQWLIHLLQPMRHPCPSRQVRQLQDWLLTSGTNLRK